MARREVFLFLVVCAGCERGRAVDAGGNEAQVQAAILAARTQPVMPETPLPPQLEVFALRDAVLAPRGSLGLTVGRPETVKLVERVGQGGLLLALTLRTPSASGDARADYFDVGCLARIASVEPRDGALLVVLQGVRRVRVATLEDRVAHAEEHSDTHTLSAPRAEQLWSAFVANAPRPPGASDGDWADFLRRVKMDADLTMPVLVNLGLPTEEVQRIFELRDAEARADALLKVLAVPALLRK